MPTTNHVITPPKVCHCCGRKATPSQIERARLYREVRKARGSVRAIAKRFGLSFQWVAVIRSGSDIPPNGLSHLPAQRGNGKAVSK